MARRWHPESTAKTRRWAAIQREWLRRQLDFSTIWTEANPPVGHDRPATHVAGSTNEPALADAARKESEADQGGNHPPRPAPLAGPRPQTRRGKTVSN